MADEYILKQFEGGAVPTTLAADITDTATSLTVAAGSSFPAGGAAPFVIVVDRGEAAEEKILCASRASNTITVQQRGYDGSAAQAHTAPATVDHVLDAYTVEQANAMANAMTSEYDLVRRGATAGSYARVPSTEWRFPAGFIGTTIAATAPTGWLFDNQAVAGCNVSYPELWALAPASWKSGTTLTIPDLTDAVLMQAGTTTLGATGGANTRTIASANLPTHTHTIDHDHGSVTSGSVSNDHTHGFSGTTSGQSVSHTHGPGTGNTFVTQFSSGAAALSVIGGGAQPDSSAGATGAASADHSHTYSGNTGGISANHTHAVDLPSLSGSSGDGGFANTALTTTPKHLAVNIIIKAH